MSRKATRRAERAVSLRRRILAGATSVIMGLGLAVGGLTPAMANNGNGQGGGQGGQGGGTNLNQPASWELLPGEECVDVGYSTENSADNPYELPALADDSREYSRVVVKAGSTGNSVENENAEFTETEDGALTAGDEFVHPEKGSISHVIVCTIPGSNEPQMIVNCTEITYDFGRGQSLDEADHVNVQMVLNGVEGQINVEVNPSQGAPQDPDGGSGYYLLFKFPVTDTSPNTPVDEVKIGLTPEEFDSGVVTFPYGSYLTGEWQIQRIQFNNQYFNDPNDPDNYIDCTDLTTEPAINITASFTPLSCEMSTGSFTVGVAEEFSAHADKVIWTTSIDPAPSLPGTVTVTEPIVVTVTARIASDSAGEFALNDESGLGGIPDPETGAITFTFTFTEPVNCPTLECIPDEFISYTYIRTGPDANTGVVTVTQPAGDEYSDQLCEKLYVTAAAWAYDYIDLKWTQTLVATKEINNGEPIETVGTYEYGVPVGCGQGDIYASRDAFPRPSPFLLSPNEPDWGDETPWIFTEVFLSDKKKFKFDGPSPTWVQTNPGCNGVEPVTPTATAIDGCDTYGSLAVSPSPFISYIVKDENGDVVATVEFDETLEQVVVPGATEGQFTVTPVAHFPYLLQNYDANDAKWAVDLGEYRECPSFTRATNIAEECDRDAPWITYSVEVTDPDGQLAGSNARLIFVDPNGIEPDHIVELGTVTVGELLEGRVLWPGASVDGDGNPTGWPGWELNASDEWVETDGNFRWTRDITEVTLEVNPSMQLPLTYPVSTLDCAADPRELEPEPVITTGNCFDPENSYMLADIPGIQWFVDGNPVDPDTYVLAPSDYDSDGNVTVVITVEIDESAVGGPYGFAEGATTSWSESFSEVTDEECVLPLTDVTLAFTDATCLEPQGLDVPKFEFDRDLAEIDEVSVDSDGDYTVVFITIGDKTTFDQSDDVAVDGRTVSSDGKTLRFVGTLDGPNDELCESIPVIDPVTFIDNCLDGGSYTIEYVEGITYFVTVNSDDAFEVVFAEGQLEKTYSANEGDAVSVMPTADAGYVLDPRSPEPFERTFNTYPNGCQLPEFPNWPASASATNEVCTPFGVTSGYITVELSVGPDSNPNPVRYYIAHETAEEQELTSAKTTVPAGSYIVTAVLENLDDSINNSGNEPVNFPLTVGVADESDCELPTLAITGASNAVTGVGIGAVIIILAGLGFVLRRQLTT